MGRLRGVVFVASLAAIAVVLAAVAALAHGASPGGNGLIAFTRYRLQDAPLWSEIYVVRPDGSGVRRVSHSTVAVEDDQARWSPDGSWIVFDRCPSDGPCSLWLVRPDGSDQQRLSPACAPSGPGEVCGDDSNASFTPDGHRVVFTHGWGHVRKTALGDEIEHSAIATLDLSGKQLTILRQLAPYAGDLQAPRMSPNGKLLVYDRYNSTFAKPSGGDALFIVPASGGTPRRLTPWRLSAGSPDWSPDSTQVLFKKFIQGSTELTPGTNLYTIKADGTGPPSRHRCRP